MQGKIKTWIWIAVVTALAVASIVLTLCLWCVPHAGGTVAHVTVDGEEVYVVDLDTVEAPYRYVVETPYGTNTLCIEKGRIAVVDSDCAGADCVHQGWISDPGQPIVCLPHRLVVRISGKDDNAVIQ